MSEARPPIRVLHVDDDPDLADLTATYLERENDRLSVHTETSGDAALERIDDVDCVISDYDMPGMDGIELLERVRDLDDELPFILYTGKGSEAVASDAIAAGVTDYLQKEHGTGQYTLLANRIENAVEQYRTRERAETLSRIRRVLREVNQELVRTRSRSAMVSNVAETLTQAAPYEFVWFGEENEATGVVEPRARAGDGRGYLDRIEIRVDDEATGKGPTGRALRDDRLAVTQTIPDDPSYEPFREPALERGFRASAAVPIRFEETTYGVLNVYTDEPNAFDEAEKGLLRELADDIGHAIHRIENENQYRTLFNRFPEPTIGVTFENGAPIIESVNPAFERIFGYEASSVRGTSARELLVPEDRLDEAADIIERSLENRDIDQEVRRKTADGEQDFLLRNIPIPGEAVPDLYWVYVDISERKANERALEELTERLELAIDAGEFGVWDWNVQTGEVTYDEQWADMLGYDLAEIGTTLSAWEDRIHPDDRAHVEKTLQSHLDGETDVYDCEHRVRTKSGDWRWIRDVGKVVEWTADGEPKRAVGIHQDVTPRREREEALQRERERFEALFESFPASVVAVSYEDGEPIVKDANSTFESVFGCDEGALGRSLNDLIVPDAERESATSLDRRLQEGERIDREVIREAADGLRDFVLRTITLSDVHELDTYAVYIDVTERKDRERAMAALHDAAAELEVAETDQEIYDIVIDTAEEVLDFALVAIDVVDDGALVQRAWSIDQSSDGYYQRTPLDEDTLATRTYHRGETIIADDLREYDIIPADPAYRSALTVPIGDRGTVQTVAREPNAFDQTDAELAELLVGHAREALDRLERARSLRRQRERLRREYDRLDTFISILSHDLRNPITVAEGRIEMANEDRQSEDLTVAENALDRMRRMVDDVLTWAREGQHVPEEDRDPIDLGTMGRNCWQNVDTSQATIEVETEATILADESRLPHVLENLFRNAIEHGQEAPSDDHSVREDDDSAGRDHITITLGDTTDGFYVADDGRGIPPAERDDIFSFGYSSTEDGSGIGLAIVKEIVEAHEWEIDVTESEDGGARFEITGVEVL